MAKKLGRVVLIHGVNIRSRRNHIRKLAPYFRQAGFSVVIPTYGYMPAFFLGLFQWLDNRLADSMSAFIREDDILIGHSNGGTLVYLISLRVKVRGAVLLNAALETDVHPHADFVHVYYNEGDWVTRASGLMPFGVWGCMGASGYSGKAHNVANIDQGCRRPALPRLHGHSDLFTAGKLRPWAKFMAGLCKKAISGVHHARLS